MQVETTSAPTRAPRTAAREEQAPGAHTSDPVAQRAVRRRLKLLAGIVLAWALIYLVVYIPANGNGSDFRVFYAAAYADAHHVEAYDWPAFWRVEQILYNGGVGHSKPFYFAPYGNPPPFALLLRPLTAIPENEAYILWAALSVLTTACGAYLGLAGWPRNRRLPATLLVTISPAALFNVRLGQISSLLLLGLGLALWLLAARRPALAGAALTIGMVKPHLMLPIALILVCAVPRNERRPALLGLLGGTAIWAVIAVAADGGIGVFGRWWTSAHNFLGSIRLQPDVASIPGLYYGSASDSTAGLLNALCLATAAGIVILLARGARGGGRRERDRLFGGGLASYFALSPYVHTGDQVLLALPLLALIGPQGRGLRDNAVLLAALAAILAPMVVFRDYHTSGINALPPLCLLLAYALGAPRGSATQQDTSYAPLLIAPATLGGSIDG